MKKQYYYSFTALIAFLAVFMIAGIEDRNSLIELKQSNYQEFPEITAPNGNPLTDKGWLYIKDNAGTSDLYFEDDAGTVTELTATAGGAVSLDTAYNQSPTITVDSTAVTLQMSHATNIGLDINKTAGSGNTIDIQNAGTGLDIDGTSSTWKVTKAGVGTFLSFILENGATIDNAANGTVSFIEGGEDLDILFTTNVIDFSTDTGAVTWEMYDGTASTVTKAADGAGDDLTLSVTGAQDSSLVLASAGTGADALTITASAGGMDLVVSNSSAADDLDSSSDSSINIVATEDAASAVVVQANGGTSETVVILSSQGTGDDSLNVDSTAGGIDVDAALSIVITSAENTADSVQLTSSAGGIDIAASGAAAGEDIDITATGSSVNITATEAAADAVVIAASTAVGGIDITSNADIDITTTGVSGEDISIVNTGGSVIITATEASGDAILLNASTALGGIDITSNADIDITTTGAAAEDISITNTGGSVRISATEAAADSIWIAAGTAAGGIDIISNADLDLSTTGAAGEDITLTNTGGSIIMVATEAAADQLKVDAQGAVAGDAINLETTDGGILLNADGSANGDIGINAADDLTLTAAGKIQHAGELLVQAETVTAANTITRAECGKTFYLDADAEFQSILPDISAVDAGCVLRFVVADAASGADYTVVSGNTLENVIYGSVIVNSTHVACSAEDTILLDDGILEGDWVSFETDGTFWYISGSAVTAGDIECSAT